MYEALCRPFGTTLDTVHDEGGPPITQRTWGLGETLVPFPTSIVRPTMDEMSDKQMLVIRHAD